MQARVLILLSLTAMLLAACTAMPPGPGPKRVTALVLDQPVSVPEGQARVFLQYGKPVGRINEFVPHCALEIRQVSGPPRTVPAGRYPVTRVQDVTAPIVLGGPGRQVAGVGVGISVGSGGGAIGIGVGSAAIGFDGDSPSDLFEGYHFWLADSARVGLMRMTCLGARAQPVDVEPPTRAEIAQALGELGRLEYAP